MKSVKNNPLPKIYSDKKGNFFIAGTNMKVEELISEKIAFGWSPEELNLQHPDLSMAQIYSALAFYSENIAFIDKKIFLTIQKSDEMKKGTSLLRKKIVNRLKQSMFFA